MNQGQQMHRPSPGDGSRMLPGIFGILLNTFALLSEVFLRNNFGYRYLTLLGAILGVLVLQFLPALVILVFSYVVGSMFAGTMAAFAIAMMTSSVAWANGTIWFNLFQIGFMARCGLHFCERDYRHQNGIQLLSTYSGQPTSLWRHIPWIGRDEQLVKRFGEPAVILMIASVVRQYDLLLALYLATSGVACFVKASLEHRLVQQRLWDVQDSMLEAAAIGGYLGQGGNRQPGQMRGVATPAALESYPEHQQKALTSALQQQAGFKDLVTATPESMFANLPAEIGGLLTDPVPLTAEEEPATDWVADNEQEPIADDWYVVSEPKQPEKVICACTVCGKKHRFNARHAGRPYKCVRCGDPFRVPESQSCIVVNS